MFNDPQNFCRIPVTNASFGDYALGREASIIGDMSLGSGVAVL